MEHKRQRPDQKKLDEIHKEAFRHAITENYSKLRRCNIKLVQLWADSSLNGEALQRAKHTLENLKLQP